jgi:peptidyl-prolyl cis-trans isomerase SurA
MKSLKLTCFGIIFSILYIYSSLAIENKILFKVNNEIITSLDIFTEIRYLETISDEFRKTEKKQSYEIAKKSLIREKIKKIELQKIFKEIKIEENILNSVILGYFRKNEIQSISDFEKYFSEIDINPNLIKKKISIEILWNQLIYNKFNQNIKINKDTIKNDLKNHSQQNEFLLSEILFNLSENEKLHEKFDALKEDIKKTSFSQTALTYSISDTANKGGKLGWIKETSISLKIKELLQNTEVGHYTNPIVIPGGFLILKVEDIREVNYDYDLDEEIKKIIKEKTDKQLNQFSNIYFNKVKKDIQINEL